MYSKLIDVVLLLDKIPTFQSCPSQELRKLFDQLELFPSYCPTGELTVAQALSVDWDLYGQFTRGASKAKSKYKILGRFFGDLKYARLNEEEVKSYRRIRASEGMSQSTINREHSIITASYNRIKRWKKLKKVGKYETDSWIIPEENPGSLVKKVDERQYARKRVLSKTEFSKFLEHCPQNIHDICMMAMLTTFRLKDLRLLSIKSINNDTNRIEIVQSKTQKPQTAWIGRKVQEILDRAKGETILDFTNFQDEFESAKRRSGVKFQFRDIRRSAARNLLTSGEDIMVVAKVLGHQNVTTTQIYTPASDADLDRAGEKLERKFSDLRR